MKNQRLEHKVFIEALGDSGLVDRKLLDSVFEQAMQSQELVPEILVREDMISDYELANVACRTFGLPFVHVFGYQPEPGALEGLDPDFLRTYGLVPLDRFGQVLTVAMPGMVPSAVLDVLLSDETTKVMAVVGSVIANREWLEQNLSAQADVVPPVSDSVPSALPAEAEEGDEWAAIFDAGEEAVQFNLQDDEEALEEPAAALPDLGVLEELGDLELLDPDPDPDPAEELPRAATPSPRTPAPEASDPEPSPEPASKEPRDRSDPDDPVIELDF